VDRKTSMFGLAVLGACGVLASSVAFAQSDKPFPYDPVCPWGRLSNGRGFIIRCLTQKEAVELGAPNAPVPPPSPMTDEKTADVLDIGLGPVTADSGDLPEAVKSLSKANDRYVQCVQSNGGLTEATGKVDVRFLVRGRGRAEGSTAKRHSGMSQAAAKCIADVVDRRFVGYPANEMVGATLVITVTKKKPN
jgi:hypothetical protein